MSKVDTKRRGLLVPAWTNSESSKTNKPRVGAVVAEGRYKGLTVAQVAGNRRIGQDAAYQSLAAGEIPPSKTEMVKARKARLLNATGSPFSHFNRSIKRD